MLENFSYENIGTNTYLVYTLNPGEQLDSMTLGMITNNKIPGFAETIHTRVDGKDFIKYNVSSKLSMNSFFIGSINKKKLINVFKGILNAVIVSDEYMIYPDSILLDKDFIFSDVSTFETIVICLPIQTNNSLDLGSFFKNIMFSAQFDQSENCDYVAKIMNFLNSSSTFSAEHFKSFLDSISDDNSINSVINNSAIDKYELPQQKAKKEEQTVYNSPAEASSRIKQNAGFSNGQASPESALVQKPVNQFNNNSTVTVNQYNKFQQKRNEENSHDIQVPDMQIPPSKKQKPDAGFSTPSAAALDSPPQNSEKKISLLYLLQHYNSENAAAYKAQKAAKKNQRNTSNNNENMQQGGFEITGQRNADTQKTNSKDSGAKTGNAVQFSVPGVQSVNNSQFSVPGDQSTNSGQFSNPVQMNLQNSTPVQKTNDVQSVQANVYNNTFQNNNGSFQNNNGSFQNNNGSFQNTSAVFSNDTTVLADFIQETTVLGVQGGTVKSVCPYLYRLKNNESIKINKTHFTIGKERSFVDYFIGDNSAISRSHAIISIKDNKYYLKDTNSTNHTYLNGEMVQSSCDIEIHNGDKIRFANEEFEFKVY